MTKGYHIEQNGLEQDLLIRESDDRIIARCEGDIYDDVEEMIMPAFRLEDTEALFQFAKEIDF